MYNNERNITTFDGIFYLIFRGLPCPRKKVVAINIKHVQE